MEDHKPKQKYSIYQLLKNSNAKIGQIIQWLYMEPLLAYLETKF